MDSVWAIQRLREHLRLTDLVPRVYDGITYREPLGSKDQLLASAQVTEKILDHVTPGWRSGVNFDDFQWLDHRAATVRALAEIESTEEVEAHLGGMSPALRADAMHPWAWEGARSLWQSGHYGEAVRAATVKVNAETQNKVGRRDVGEAALVKEAFSESPATDKAARLRFEGDDGGTTATSIRRGIFALADACYGLIRNPASHDPIGEVPEQVALEQLATISFLARWIDGATIERA